MSANPQHRNALIAQLIWQAELGADEAIHDQSLAHVADLKLADILHPASEMASASLPASGQMPAPIPTPIPAPVPTSISTPVPTSASAPLDLAPADQAMFGDPDTAAQLAAIDNLSDLRTALVNFDQCALKNTASNLVFSDGNPGARVMVIGEAPGRDEDRVGLPFVGASGQLLDKMLASIGLDRTSVYIANLLPWRPPGNRTPTAEETALLLPWLKRHIQLANPDYVLILGGSSAKALLGTKDGILKVRGKWRDVDYGDGVMRPTICSLHPAYLLRSPAQKRLSYQDLLALAAQLDS